PQTERRSSTNDGYIRAPAERYKGRLGRSERRDPSAQGTAEMRPGGPSDGTIPRSEGHGCRLPRADPFPGLAPQATMVIPTNGITCAYQAVRQATIGSARWLIGL